jgi:hypothetical protein
VSANSRFAELTSKMLDDAISDDELAELLALVDANPSLRLELVDHLLLDNLLEENLGQEPLTALVDLVGDSSSPLKPLISITPTHQTQIDSSSALTRSRWSWNSGWLALAASLLVAISFFMLQDNREAFASASQIVQAAIQTHSAPIERIYVVEVKRGEANKGRFDLLRDVRVATQGDRYWVQMRGARDWSWGRNEQGDMWMTLGPRRAVVVKRDEMGVPLRYIGDLCTLNLETLLQNILKHCQLEMSEAPSDTTIIVATPRQQWVNRPLQRATIEVDRETKAIRKLVIERTNATSTFTLVDSRLANESLYGPEGHLSEPYQIFSTETNASRRREFITNWFGPMSEQWMQIQETQSNE